MAVENSSRSGAFSDPLRIFIVLAFSALLAISTLWLVPPADAQDASTSEADLGLMTFRVWPGRPLLHVVDQNLTDQPDWLNVIIAYQPDAQRPLAQRLEGTGAVLLKDMQTLSMASVRIRSDAVESLRDHDFVVQVLRTAVTP